MNPAGRRVYITPAMHISRSLGRALAAAGLAVVPTTAALAQGGAEAQNAQAASCATPDSLIVRGNSRVLEPTVRSQVAFVAGATLTGADLQRGIRALYATGQFSDVRLSCVVLGGDRTALQVDLVERPLLGQVTVQGTAVVGNRTVRDRINLSEGLPLDPAVVARSAAAIDSLYEARGYYLSRVTVDSARTDGRVDLTFRIEEGGRLAISGVEIVGNERVSSEDIVGAMQTKPEGFFWFRRGAFDETAFAADVGERIPQLYASRGYIDAGVMQDTIVIDRELGKGLVRLTINEGPQYRLGAFDVVGNQRFSDEQVRAFYPFTGEGPTLTQRVTDVIRGRDREEGVFDQARWTEATGRLQEAYGNEGYLFARVQPVAERTVGPDSVPVVNLRWDIVEGDPAIINRVEIRPGGRSGIPPAHPSGSRRMTPAGRR